MFSSTTNPFPHLQIPFAGAGFFPFHHHIDPLSAVFPPPTTTNSPTYNHITKRKKEEDRMKKKERHSKIMTSQGLRDRRVRLSIGVSREFFDLQDMLGFETASKTIEWLLGKSSNHIQELKIKKNKSCSEEGFGKKMKINSEKDEFAREYRAKKRERARERTREKLFISNPNYGFINYKNRNVEQGNIEAQKGLWIGTNLSPELQMYGKQ